MLKFCTHNSIGQLGTGTGVLYDSWVLMHECQTPPPSPVRELWFTLQIFLIQFNRDKGAENYPFSCKYKDSGCDWEGLLKDIEVRFLQSQ